MAQLMLGARAPHSYVDDYMLFLGYMRYKFVSGPARHIANRVLFGGLCSYVSRSYGCALGFDDTPLHSWVVEMIALAW